jgi:hypothetical protein
MIYNYFGYWEYLPSEGNKKMKVGQVRSIGHVRWWQWLLMGHYSDASPCHSQMFGLA